MRGTCHVASAFSCVSAKRRRTSATTAKRLPATRPRQRKRRGRRKSSCCARVARARQRALAPGEHRGSACCLRAGARALRTRRDARSGRDAARTDDATRVESGGPARRRAASRAGAGHRQPPGRSTARSAGLPVHGHCALSWQSFERGPRTGWNAHSTWRLPRTPRRLRPRCAGIWQPPAAYAGDLARSWEVGELRGELARRTHDPFLTRHVHLWLGALSIWRGDWVAAQEHISHAEPEINLVDSPEPRSYLGILRGLVHYYHGEFGEAQAAFDTALDAMRRERDRRPAVDDRLDRHGPRRGWRWRQRPAGVARELRRTRNATRRPRRAGDF